MSEKSSERERERNINGEDIDEQCHFIFIEDKGEEDYLSHQTTVSVLFGAIV